MNEEMLLEEGPNVDFKGATLQIKHDADNSRSPSSLGDDSESVAKLPLTPEALNDNTVTVRENGFVDSRKPAVSGGTDTISPITSIPKRLSEKFRQERTKTERTTIDVICQNQTLEQDNAKDYFTFRDGIVENAVKDSISNIVVEMQDGEVIGSWLLTEISLWDNDKERLILLCANSLITVKYDFIALKQLEFKKVPLDLLDTLVIGDLVYPPGSLVPTRNMRGVRAMWNRSEPLTFSKKWNPFNNEVPWTTYSSHPLFWHKDADNNKMYDVEDFARKLVETVEKCQKQSDGDVCRVEHKPIVLQNYVGLGSLIHNRNSLGFFKVRGKFSF